MIEFLEELRMIRHREKEEKKEAKPWKPKLRHDHSHDVKAYVVFLRYGSLTEPGPKWHTFSRIREITGVKINTAHYICKHWEKNGFQIVNHRLGIRSRARW